MRKQEKVLATDKVFDKDFNAKGRQDIQKSKKEKGNEKAKDERLKEPIKIQQRPKQAEIVRSESKQGKSQPAVNLRPDPPKIRILKTDTPNTSAIATMTQSSPMESVSKGYPGHEVFSQLAETTEKLLQNVLTETEVGAIPCKGPLNIYIAPNIKVFQKPPPSFDQLVTCERFSKTFYKASNKTIEIL